MTLLGTVRAGLPNNAPTLRDVLLGVRQEIEHVVEDAAGQEAQQSLRFAVSGSALVVSTTSPAVAAMEHGTPPRTMASLMGKVIPLRTPRGVVFRRVTLRSLARGGWRYPGTPPKELLREAIQRYEHKNLRAHLLGQEDGSRVSLPPL